MTDLVHSGFASIPGGDEAAGATMMEKAARALSDHFKCEWETMRDADREMIRGYVRAVLLAVRGIPDSVAFDAVEPVSDSAPFNPMPEVAWRAMIDTILADGEGR